MFHNYINVMAFKMFYTVVFVKNTDLSLAPADTPLWLEKHVVKDDADFVDIVGPIYFLGGHTCFPEVPVGAVKCDILSVTFTPRFYRTSIMNINILKYYKHNYIRCCSDPMSLN